MLPQHALIATTKKSAFSRFLYLNWNFEEYGERAFNLI